MPQTPKCPDCGSEMKLKQTSRFFYTNGVPRKFYGCKRYPECHGTRGSYPDGTPTEDEADSETKRLRKKLYEEADRIWGPWRSDLAKKTQFYTWLKANHENPDVKLMKKETLKDTLSKMVILKDYDPWVDEVEGDERSEASAGLEKQE